MLSPLPRHSGWAHYFAHSPSRISLPRYGSRVGLCIVLFEACSAFTRVTACTLAPSPIRDALSEGFSHFVTSIAAPVASGWSVCRVGLAPTGKRRLSTAHAISGHSPLRTEAGILLNEHVAEDGPTVFTHACRLGAEGIVSKRVDGTYRSSPCPIWIKVRNPAIVGAERDLE